MTEPGEDDYVNIEDDYSYYDYEWFQDQPNYTDNISDPNYFLAWQDHALWPEAQAYGWYVQPRGNFLVKGPASMTPGESLRQWIIPPTAYDVRHMSHPLWTHMVEDSHQFELRPGSGQQINEILVKADYRSLGDTLEAARSRERGQGYQDYKSTGENRQR